MVIIPLYACISTIASLCLSALVASDEETQGSPSPAKKRKTKKSSKPRPRIGPLRSTSDAGQSAKQVFIDGYHKNNEAPGGALNPRPGEWRIEDWDLIDQIRVKNSLPPLKFNDPEEYTASTIRGNLQKIADVVIAEEDGKDKRELFHRAHGLSPRIANKRKQPPAPSSQVAAPAAAAATTSPANLQLVRFTGNPTASPDLSNLYNSTPATPPTNSTAMSRRNNNALSTMGGDLLSSMPAAQGPMARRSPAYLAAAIANYNKEEYDPDGTGAIEDLPMHIYMTFLPFENRAVISKGLYTFIEMWHLSGICGTDCSYTLVPSHPSPGQFLQVELNAVKKPSWMANPAGKFSDLRVSATDGGPTSRVIEDDTSEMRAVEDVYARRANNRLIKAIQLGFPCEAIVEMVQIPPNHLQQAIRNPQHYNIHHDRMKMGLVGAANREEFFQDRGTHHFTFILLKCANTGGSSKKMSYTGTTTMSPTGGGHPLGFDEFNKYA